MTVLSVEQIVGQALPSLAPASSSGPAGSGLGGAINTSWQDVAITKKQKEMVARREALRRAAAKVEARPQTKTERLYEQAGKRSRVTGSETERASTRGSVSKAVGKLADVPGTDELNTAEVRDVLDRLQQRYPGRRLSDMIKTAEATEAAFLEDPIAARQALLINYSRMPVENLPVYVEPKHESSLRGSLRRARQDQANAAELKDAQARYGKGLPKILQQILDFDTALIQNAALASARLAAAYGAPVVPEQIPQYEAAQAQRQVQRQVQKRYETVLKGVNAAIEHGFIPGDEESLAEIAAVLALPKFQHNRADGLETLQRAAAIAAHPDHVWITGKRAKSSKRGDAASKSISGGPSAGRDGRTGPRGAGTGTIHDSIARVRAAL